MSAAEVILTATDWSENARRAVQRAAYIGERRQAAGLLLHVARHGWFSRAIDSTKSQSLRICLERIDKLAQSVRLQTGFSFETQIHAGNVAASIAKAARASGACLIALGRWTDSALIRWTDTPFEQSIALRLLNQVASPVLIVKGDPKQPYRRVLVAIDQSDSAIGNLRQAHALAPEAELVVVHALDHALEQRKGLASAFDDRLRELRMKQHEDALDRVHDLVERSGVSSQKIVKVVDYGYAPKFILDKEREFLVDLVVIGTNRRSRFRRLFFGGATSQVLARSQCDVMVIPEKSKGLLGSGRTETS